MRMRSTQCIIVLSLPNCCSWRTSLQELPHLFSFSVSNWSHCPSQVSIHGLVNIRKILQYLNILCIFTLFPPSSSLSISHVVVSLKHLSIPSGQNRQKKTVCFVNSALKIQWHVVKNTSHTDWFFGDFAHWVSLRP